MVNEIMLLNFTETKETKAANKIDLQEFVNIDLDVLGYYALGHHEPDLFLKALAKKEGYIQLSEHEVRRSWAVFKGKDFEEVDELTSGAIPITSIEIYD